LPQAGDEKLAILQASGMPIEQCRTMIESGAIADAQPGRFAWAPLREKEGPAIKAP